ncbi:MAG TPA: choice-of-anchor Q domain-containing protein [Verrucomicrobiae bacterium]|nr:choice-of-anchor Q domain-containing protein [Verrucomicrobiae bacterium]
MNRFLLVTTLCGALSVTTPLALRAATITVTNAASFGPGTLDEAIASASDGDTIVFAVPLPATIVIQGDPEELSSSVTISGPGADRLTVSGDGTNRIFFVDEGIQATISGLTLSNGVTSVDDLGDVEGGGGAVVNYGTLTISACALKNNLSKGGDGQALGGGGAAGGGGAIINGSIDPFFPIASTLYVVNSTFCDNQAIGGGGDHAGGGGGGFGGAIFNAYGSVFATNCTFAANTARGGASGIGNGTSGAGDGGEGLNLDGSNGTGSLGSGDGSPGGDAGVGGGGGAGSEGERDAGPCTGGTGGNGGMGGFGGGGGAGGPGANGCFVVMPGDGGNGGNGGNGGDGGFGGGGGGTGIGGNPTGAGTLTGSLGIPGTNGLGAASGVSTNGGAGGGFGGAIFNYAVASTFLVNCTIASNTAAGGSSVGHLSDGQGTAGGVYNAEDFVGFLEADAAGTIQIVDTIIATNTATSAPDVGGSITSGGYNLIGVGNGSVGFVDGVNGDLVGATAAPLNPLLGPLTNNGGTTYTMALILGSPAINAGDPTYTPPPSVDQRGSNRVVCSVIDIGAFESQHIIPPVISCPADIVVDGVSPSGAVVSFAPTASSMCSSITVINVPSSGSSFSVGDTTVTCSVADTHGNTNSCTFNIHVNSVSEQLNALTSVVEGFGLKRSLQNSILNKLKTISRQTGRGRTTSACRQVDTLVRQAQLYLANGRLTEDQTVTITTVLIRVRGVLGC